VTTIKLNTATQDIDAPEVANTSKVGADRVLADADDVIAFARLVAWRRGATTDLGGGRAVTEETRTFRVDVGPDGFMVGVERKRFSGAEWKALIGPRGTLEGCLNDLRRVGIGFEDAAGEKGGTK
jgi:hypothetical protein